LGTKPRPREGAEEKEAAEEKVEEEIEGAVEVSEVGGVSGKTVRYNR